MIQLETAYRHGFLDGMRNCGRLVIDVNDKDLWLSEDWLLAIQEGYRNRNYGKREDEGRAKTYKFIREQVLEIVQLKETITELRRIIKAQEGMPE